MVSTYLVQLPSPPGSNVFREWAGGMGTSSASSRTTAGHDPGHYDVPYLSLLYIARVIEQAGVEFRYVDGQSKREFDQQAFLDELQRDQPSVLVTVINLPSLEPDIALLRAIRVTLPKLRIVLLGPTAKWYKRRLLCEGLADLVMEESEELITARNVVRLVRNESLHTSEGASFLSEGEILQRPATTPMKTLNFVDFPAYELLDFKRYESDCYFGERLRYATLFTAKGCPYHCSYCPYPYGFGYRLIFRSPELVGDDIERLVRQFDVQQILFRDQVFTLHRKHALAVCNELIRRDLGVRWLCETRYDVVDQELLGLMYQAGCREIHYGLESADPQMFAEVAKSDGPRSLDLFAQVIGWTKAQGIRTHAHLIVGLPEESWSTVRNTGRWLRMVKPDSIQLSYFMPYPGTPIYRELKESLELGDPAAIPWHDCGSFTRPVLPTKHMTIEEVELARERLSWDLRYSLLERLGMRVRRLLGMESAA